MSIWRHKKGWRYQFQSGGTRYAKAGFATRAEALAAQEAHKKELKAGKVEKTPSATDFRTAAYEHLDYCQRRFAAKTYKEKRYVYASFLATAGNLPLENYDARTLEAYLSTRPSNNNWNVHRKTLCSFFEWCFKRRMVDRNPCIYVGTMPHQAKKKVIPTQEEILKLLLSAASIRPFLYALYSLAARVGEINKLRWEDINFTTKTATLWTRKGDGSYRPQVKPLNPELYEELRRLYDKRSGEWVFPNPDTHLPYVDRRKQLKRICVAAGVPYLGFHAIRHHVASLLADTHKQSLPTIQKMLGHSRASTSERYIQSLGDGVREASDLLQIFTGKDEPRTAGTHQTKKESDD
jgi:integrase